MAELLYRILSLCLLLPSLLFAGDITQQQSDRLTAILKMSGLSGASLLIQNEDGDVLFSDDYGNMSVEDVAHIASSTKPIATVGVLLAVQDGALSLDDTLSNHLPEFTGTPVEHATLRNLLSHTSGIGGQYTGGRPRGGTLAEFSELVASDGQLSEPGAFAYSGVGMDVACRMAEAAMASPMEQHIQNRVLKPLQMESTSFPLPREPSTEWRYISCGGGLKSTLHDMANFYQLLLHRGVFDGSRLVDEHLMLEMSSLHAVNEWMSEQISYSIGEYGLGIYRDRVAQDGTPLTLSHAGSFGTYPWTDINDGVVGVLFSQDGLRSVESTIQLIVDVVRGNQSSIPKDKPRRLRWR